MVGQTKQNKYSYDRMLLFRRSFFSILTYFLYNYSQNKYFKVPIAKRIKTHVIVLLISNTERKFNVGKKTSMV